MRQSRPMWLKYALKAANVKTADAARALGFTRTQLSNVLHFKSNRTRRFLAAYYRWLAGISPESSRVREWLISRGMSPEAALTPWAPGSTPGQTKHNRPGMRPVVKKRFTTDTPAQIQIEEIKIMLTLKAMRHFKLRRSPFDGEIREIGDVFLSEDHIFLKEMMLEAARYAGFVAVFGEVGSGKSTIRKLIVKTLMDEGIHIIFPQILDKRKISASSLLDAIIYDLADEPPRQSLEAKSRQAVRHLKTRRDNGLRQVLVIEEAHLLQVWALKHLKGIYELEDGYQKLIGVCLVGQPELAARFDESRYPQLREVARRVTSAEISGFNERDLARYLIHKMERIGARPETVFTDDAYTAISRRLRSDNGAGEIRNMAYPLSINNMAALAMNTAADLGEPVVSADVVMAL